MQSIVFWNDYPLESCSISAMSELSHFSGSGFHTPFRYFINTCLWNITWLILHIMLTVGNKLPINLRWHLIDTTVLLKALIFEFLNLPVQKICQYLYCWRKLFLHVKLSENLYFSTLSYYCSTFWSCNDPKNFFDIFIDEFMNIPLGFFPDFELWQNSLG